MVVLCIAMLIPCVTSFGEGTAAFDDSVFAGKKGYTAQEDGSWAIGTTDNGDTSSLRGFKAHSQRYHISAEDTKLGGCANEHQLGIGQQCREVRHRTDAQKDERGIPSLSHTLIEDVQH